MTSNFFANVISSSAMYNKDRGGLAIFKQHAGKKLSENSSATGVLF